MPSMRSDENSLIHIRDNIQAARQFTAGLFYESFAASRLTFYATTRALEIVSEAARRLSPALRDRHPSLPWKQIMGIGNVLRHDYDDVQERMIWMTVQDHLGGLLAAVEAELSSDAVEG